MRCLTNIEKSKKATVLAAIRESGQDVHWMDKPDERMPEAMRAEYGSVWARERDCSAFWAAYRRIDEPGRADITSTPTEAP